MLQIENNKLVFPSSILDLFQHLFFSHVFVSFIRSSENKDLIHHQSWASFNCMVFILPYKIPNGNNNITFLHHRNFNAYSVFVFVFIFLFTFFMLIFVIIFVLVFVWMKQETNLAPILYWKNAKRMIYKPHALNLEMH